jgi:hypothetical protein
MKNYTITKTIFVIALLISIPVCANASPLTKALKNWDPVRTYGNIMGVGKGYIIANEKKILIVDEKISGTVYKTSIMGLDEKPLDNNVLKKGVFIVVNGAASVDKDGANVIVAREIYVSTRHMTSKEMEKYPKLQQLPESW